MYYRDMVESTPLHYAAAADDNAEQLVAMLIDAGADINPKDSTDVCVFHIVVASNVHYIKLDIYCR